MACHPEFGINLKSSVLELHPSPKDSSDRLMGSFCCSMKLNDSVSNQLLNFIQTHECHDGMEIGHLQFATSKAGKLSFEAINNNLKQCTLTLQTEPSRRLHEIYETEYDRPPSTAMFLRRKGFVHTKLIVKPVVNANHSSVGMARATITNVANPQRAVTRINRVPTSKKLNRKRVFSNTNEAPANKRRKIEQNKRATTLKDALGEILYVEQKTFTDLKNIISSRTSINFNEGLVNKYLEEIATYYEPNNSFYLKADYYENLDPPINWQNSSILTTSEKRQIRERSGGDDNDENENMNNDYNDQNNGNMDIRNGNGDISNRRVTRCNDEGAEEFEDKYDVVSGDAMYTKYSKLYDEKYGQIQQWAKSIAANAKYFKEMKTLIHNETDDERKKQMTEEFRSIFKERGPSVKKMKNAVQTAKIECTVIKNRINDYVEDQEKKANVATA
mmetsp:Transcript_17436/g.15630  ORF Transcript_17436/g.15630 Transcript_17436/m.15630 type:complete len:445 (+) Transcript_17436:91-1425(+)